MADSPVPDDVRRFLHRHIETVAQWEGLLVLKAHSGEALDAATVACRLYIKDSDAEALLDRLSERGLVAVAGHDGRRRFQYRPATPGIGEVVERAAQLYGTHLIAVTHIIHARPRRGVEAFANAFRLRKE